MIISIYSLLTCLGTLAGHQEDLSDIEADNKSGISGDDIIIEYRKESDEDSDDYVPLLQSAEKMWD